MNFQIKKQLHKQLNNSLRNLSILLLNFKHYSTNLKINEEITRTRYAY